MLSRQDCRASVQCSAATVRGMCDGPSGWLLCLQAGSSPTSGRSIPSTMPAAAATMPGEPASLSCCSAAAAPAV